MYSGVSTARSSAVGRAARSRTFQHGQIIPYPAGAAYSPLTVEARCADRWEHPLQLRRRELPPWTPLLRFERGLPDAGLLEPLPPRATSGEEHVQVLQADEARNVTHDLSREVRPLFHCQHRYPLCTVGLCTVKCRHSMERELLASIRDLLRSELGPIKAELGPIKAELSKLNKGQGLLWESHLRQHAKGLVTTGGSCHEAAAAASSPPLRPSADPPAPLDHTAECGPTVDAHE